MKKILLIMVGLCGCSINSQQITSASTQKPIPQAECTEFKKVKVFQTLPSGGLASICKHNSSDECNGMTVFVPNRWDMQLWDEKIVTAPEGKCFVYADTISYTTKNNTKKTVPVLGFDYEYWSTTPEEANSRALSEFEDVWHDCRYNVKKTAEYSKKSDKEKQRLETEGLNWCNCIYENMINGLNNRGETLEENARNRDDVEKGMKVCNKKYPWTKEKI